MAPKILRGFGATKQKDDKSSPSTVRVRPNSKKDNSKKIPPAAEKRNLKIPSETIPNPSMKPRTEGASSHVEHLIGPAAAAAYIGENEVHSWQNMDTENKIHSMIQASSQMLIQSLGHAQKMHKERLYISKLESEVKKLSEMIVENDNKWKKDLDAKDAMIEEELK